MLGIIVFESLLLLCFLCLVLPSFVVSKLSDNFVKLLHIVSSSSRCLTVPVFVVDDFQYHALHHIYELNFRLKKKNWNIYLFISSEWKGEKRFIISIS